MSRTDEPKSLEATQASPGVLLHQDGCTIDDYVKKERLGEGSFGEVWKAERFGFEVALKILKTSVNSDEAKRDLRSLNILKELKHPFLVHTYGFWSDGDRLYIEMELAEGGSLKDRLAVCKNAGEVGIPKEELLRYFYDTASALDYLHNQRPAILHRDIKPGNILLAHGCAKLADFGLLRQVTGDHTSTKTQGGTPVYMAPESIERDVFSAQTDLFSFAVTYAELRQGALPFTGLTPFQVCNKILREPPELSDIFHAEELKVLLKALDKNPRNRFASCGAFVAELNRVVPWLAVDPPPLSNTSVPPTPSPRTLAPDKRLSTESPPLTPATTGNHVSPAHTQAPAAAPSTVNTFNHDQTAGHRPIESMPAPPISTVAERPSPLAPSIAPPRNVSRQWWKILLPLLLVGIAGSAGIWFFANPAKPPVLKDDIVTPPIAKKDDVKPPKDHPIEVSDVSARVDELLKANEIAAARDALLQDQTLLADVRQVLQNRIDDKQKVLAALKTAEAKLAAKDYESCLAALHKIKPSLVYDVDQRAGSKIENSAERGKSARDAEHKKLLDDVDEQINAGRLALLPMKLDELVAFRAAYPKTDWEPGIAALHYRLAAAYVADKTAAKDALAQFEKVLELPASVELHKKAATEAAEYALQLAETSVADPTNDWPRAIANSKRCRRFALALQEWNLEAAAKFNGKAVRINAVAVYNEKGGHKGKAENAVEYYRVLEDAVKGKPLDGFSLPVIVEKIKWAPVKKDSLASNIREGETAVTVGKNLADRQTAADAREYWEKLAAECLVYTAIARSDLVSWQLDKNELNKEKEADRKILLRSYAQVLDSYQEARALKRYADKWPGELAFRIGFVHYAASSLLKSTDRAAAKKEAEFAHRELSESLRSITESMKNTPEPKVPAVVRDARNKIKKALPELENEYKIAPRRDSLLHGVSHLDAALALKLGRADRL